VHNTVSADKFAVMLLAQHYYNVVLVSQLTLFLSSDFETWEDSDK
jgi:hypothetical protein